MKKNNNKKNWRWWIDNVFNLNFILGMLFTMAFFEITGGLK